MNKLAYAGACALAASVTMTASADINVWAPKDVATIDIEKENPEGTASAVYFRTGDDGGVFTLGADTDWRNKVKWVGPNDYNNNPIVFDFSEGDHTFRVPQVYWANKAHVTFKGGKWYTSGDWRFAGYGTATERTVIFDGAFQDCARSSGTYFWGANGDDNLIVVTNGSEIAGNNAAFIHATGHRNLLYVSNGSKIGISGADVDRGVAGTDYGLTSNKVVVTGAGTTWNSPNQYLMAGIWSSGNTTLIDDHAAVLKVSSTRVGYGDYARSNTLEIANHSCVTNNEGMLVGYSAGATHNKLVIRDSEYFNSNSYSADQIGGYGSYNEALFENVDFTRLFRIGCGIMTGAHDNKVTLKGATKIAGPAFKFNFFGCGQNNTFVLDNFSHNYNSVRAHMSITENGGLERPSTNNTLRVVNGSDFYFYDFFCSVACASNTIEIVDSTVREGHDMTIRGDSNTLILDNGTLKLTQSGENFVLGSSGDDTTGYVETNNQFIIRGTHPKVARMDAESMAAGKVYDGGKVVIEVPETGYEQANLPIFDGTGLTFYNDTKLEVKVPEALLKSLPATTEYKLADSITIENYTGGYSQFVADVNAKLPKGSEVYYASGSNALWLRVKPIRGLAIIIK